MATLPLVPQIKRYRGAKPEKHRKVAEGHAVAQHICDHVNALIANNPAEIQQYTFGYIAADLRLTKERSAMRSPTAVRTALPSASQSKIAKP